MTVRVPFQLRRRKSGPPARASALFIPGREVPALLSVCARMGLDPSGRVHDVSGGFLLKLAQPSEKPVPGATRLREMSADLFVPVDADLIPALLDDEAAGLVRDGGLIFLPGGRVLRFDGDAPVGLPALVSATPRPRRDWGPLPEPRPLADRLVEVSREWPEPSPEDFYSEWEEEVRRPRPSPRPGPGQDEAGPGEGAEDLEGAGSGTAGRATSGLRGLGGSIRELAGRAGSGARSLREKIQWGMLDHSGLVRKLLREFRQGDGERALRHAPSMAPPDPRTPRVSGGDRFPFRRVIYNLFDLLGGPPRGGAVGVWQANPGLVEELRREYRKAAERAIHRGDFRRAAYIHGKLLGDDRQAAAALMRGGLHRDAAILLLQKVNDKAAAAAAFEAAGMVDRAIGLYRELGRFEAAGDLLRRIGDEAQALRAYHAAAGRALEATPRDYLEVGRILWHKAGHREPAVDAYRKGWAQRPGARASACALELIAIHASRAEVAPLRHLLDEADAFFGLTHSVRDAEAFYNRMATAVAAVPALSEFAEEVHDRARSALADQLRFEIEAGRTPVASVSMLFGVPTLWTPSFVRDAQFAAATASEGRVRDRFDKGGRRPGALGVQVGRGRVTAACQATATAEVFLAVDGTIHAFRPGRDQVVTIPDDSSRWVEAMTTDPDGQVLVALRRDERGIALGSFIRQPDGSFRRSVSYYYGGASRAWLTPILPMGAQWFVGLGDGQDLAILDATSGLIQSRRHLFRLEASPGEALLLSDGEAFRVLTHDGQRWLLQDQESRLLSRSEPAAWRPRGGSRSPRCSVPLSWIHLDGVVKVVGLDEHGAVHAAQLCVEEGVLALIASPVATVEGGYLAATRIGPGKVVAVSATRADWLSDDSDRFSTFHSLHDPGLASTVACFASTSPHEVLVVSAEGLVSRVHVSRKERRA